MPDPLKIKILTVATDNKSVGYCNWIESAEQLNLDFTVLGVGTKWCGFDTKTKLILQYLDQLVGNYIVVILDCYDVIFNATCGEEFEERFFASWEMYKSDLVIGVESLCGPNCYSDSKDTNPLNTSDFKYPNGGCIIGTPKSVKYIYTRVLESGITDDQYALGKIVATQSYLNYDYDSNQYFVANIVPNRIRDVRLDTTKALWVSEYSQHYPLFLHTYNVTVDKGYRYNTLLKEIHPKLNKLSPIPWYAHWRRAIQCNWNDPCYVQIWLPGLLGLIFIPTILIILIRLKKCSNRCNNKEGSSTQTLP